MTQAADKTNLTGAVLVIGGGVGAMAAALDLADSGFHVTMVERGPSIGGRMAQLDKTFPTDDCSMCTLAPRLVTTGKHLNIDILTNSEVSKLEGEPGNLQPPRHTRVQVTYRSKFWRTFRSGAFDLKVQIAAEFWTDGIGGYDAAGSPGRR